ncbi:GspH/FimT family pseudopilin [Chitinilyticum piscinae]|uniref:Type II secretion system protein H n=1 Tax=Chitinilyticum piscinae TaxID=2866724 RepID=A0A8J7FLT3_9NEIS|nr:GspH/FimT family pseudopilin [Chitinilyticum piscinae]MBE9610442.1 GspH/FimT family pseudopilin [Chitinilyticum piscinae]
MLFLQKRQTGFTLIELMLVVALIGIILAIAVPNFTEWYQRKKLEGIANDFAALIQNARIEAVRRNSSTFLITTRSNDSSWSLRAVTSTTCAEGSASCELSRITPALYPEYLLTSLSSDFAAGATEINPVDSLFKFSSGATAAQTVVFGFASYRLQVKVTSTGLTSICTPASTPTMPGYSTCS